MNNILISVIVPVYNVEDYIEECIHSLINQTCQEFETIFVDDCGKDRSVDIIQEYINLGKLRFATIIKRQQNGGLSAARNTGIENSHGEYLYFLDSDDYLPNNAIAEFSKVIRIRDYDVVIADYLKTPGGNVCQNRLSSGFLVDKDISESYYSNKIVVTAWNKLVHREFLLREHLFFEEGIIHEDVLWSFLVMSKAKSLYYINNPTYVYRLRENSIMTNNFGKKNVNSLVKIIKVMSSRKDVMADKMAIKFFFKKCLEFSLKVYSHTSMVIFKEFKNNIRPYTHNMHSCSVSSLVWKMIVILPFPLSVQIMKILLKTKFNYLNH